MVYDLSSTPDKFSTWFARFAPHFPRAETRKQAENYVRTLLLPGGRKNGWQVARKIGDETPDATQRLLYKAKWDTDTIRDELQQWVVEKWKAEDAIVAIQEGSWQKKGNRSVGVHRYANSIGGKNINGQIALFLSYQARRVQVLIDRQLFLPLEWCTDMTRRAQAKVPENLSFQEKPSLALAMLNHAWHVGVPIKWVIGNAEYGNTDEFRANIAQRWYYVLAVSSDTPVWMLDSAPSQETRIEMEPRPRPQTVASVVEAWAVSQWKRIRIGDVENFWIAGRILDGSNGVQGMPLWLIAKHAREQPKVITYYLSNAPRETSLLKLAVVASATSAGQRCLESAQCERGLADYEVRYWHSWYRHVTLAMLASAWQTASHYFTSQDT